MPFKKCLIILLLILILVPVCQAGSGDEVWINDYLKKHQGETVIIPAGTYNIKDQIKVPKDTTVQGEVGDNGEPLTVFFLDANADLSHQESMVLLSDNTKVFDIRFEGNSANRDVPIKKNKKTGNGYDNFLSAYYSKNIEVARCVFNDNNGDGFRINRCTDVSFHDNYASEGGHDVFYQLRSERIEAYNNTVYTRVNSALRAMDCSHVRWYNNVILTNGNKGTGLAMQIQHDAGTIEDFEVFNNLIVASYGPGLWLVDKTGNYEELHLHHNVFLNCGFNKNIYWVGGIIANGFDNAVIEHNVFEGSNLGAVNFWLYYKGWDHEATTVLRNNIFLDSVAGGNSKSGGWGVNNEIPEQVVISENNCYYNNAAGNTRGCSVSSTDYFTDPKTEPTLCDIKWDGSQWVIPNLDPSEMGAYSGIYDDLKDPTDAELEEFEYNSLFGILGIKEDMYTDSGITEQTEEDIRFELEGEVRGKVTGAIKIVGFSDVAYKDGVPFIHGEDSIMVKHIAMLTPMDIWWNGGVSRFEKTIDKKIEDGTAYANLTIYLKTYNWKENKVTGTKYKKYKESTYTFSDSVPSYAIYAPPESVNVTVNIYDGEAGKKYTLVTVENVSQQRNEFEYDGKTAVNDLLIGERMTASDNIISTNFFSVDMWEGDISRYGRSAYIDGVIDPEKLKVRVYSIYGDEIKPNVTVKYNYWNGDGLSSEKVYKTVKIIFLLYILHRLYKISKI